jgi:hypothetical protein
MAVDRILRKGFWAISLVFVVLAAFLDARAVGHLVGVVLAPEPAEDPDWSFAAFGEGSDAAADGAERTILRRRNGDVGDRTIELVGRDRVWLKTANARCQAKLFDPVPPLKPAARAGA